MKVKFMSKTQNRTTSAFNKPKPQNIRTSLLISKTHQKQINQRYHNNASKTKRNISLRKSKNNIIQSHSSALSIKSIDMDKYEKLLEYHKVAIKQYKQLLQLYETNQWKLNHLIKKELINKKYLYPSQILQFLKDPKIQSLKRIKHNIFKIELQKITDFLIEFNANKKIKKIQIIRQSMEKRESMIRKSAKLQQYYDMYQFMRNPLKNNQGCTLYDQLRFISENDYSVIPKKNIDILENVFHKIRSAEDDIYFKIKKQARQRKSRNDKMLGIDSNKIRQST